MKGAVDLANTTIETLGCWNIGMSPAKRLPVLGSVILKPTFFVHRKRRVVIELHRAADNNNNNNNNGKNDQASKGDGEKDAKALGGNDQVYFCIHKLKKVGDLDDDDDDTVDNSDITNASSEKENDSIDIDTKVWTERYRYPLSAVTLDAFTNKNKTRIDLKLGIGDDREERDMEFENEQEAIAFNSLWNDVLNRAKSRAIRQLKEYQERTMADRKDSHDTVADDLVAQDPEEIMDETTQGKKTVNVNKTTDAAAADDNTPKIKLLVDIVSGENLPIADLLQGTSDPYVIVQMGGKNLHKTRHVPNDCNPIWTIKHKSLCLIELPLKEFMLANAMLLLVKDYDILGADDTLGYVKVPCKNLLEGTGERNEYTLETYDGGKKNNQELPAKLYLRFKQATNDDIEFMKVYETYGDNFGVFSDEVYLPMQKRCNNMFKRMHKRNAAGTKLTRTIPLPDPDRDKDETKFMSSEDIQAEALKESTNWVQAGSGDIGTLYFELIGCNDLPTMDTCTFGTIDAFACIVYEDSIVNTDVIPKCKSPRWMPWTYRAFKFQMAHPSTDIMLGIFDRDSAYDPINLAARIARISNLHDAAGRVVIELSKLQPDTTYLLEYPIYYGETKEQRQKAKGTVTVRLRMEFPSVRKALLAALTPPKNSVIAVRSKSQWSVAHYTTEGAIDDDAFSIATITRYLAELQDYLTLVDTIKSALLFIVMWRNHCPVTLGKRSFELPLHSITAYFWAIKLAWNYDLLPSFLFFAIGWAMLACHEQVNRHPSKWHNSPSYFEFLRRLTMDSSSPERIESGRHAQLIQDYETKQEEERERRKKQRWEEQAKRMQIQEEVNAKMEEADKAERSGFDDGSGLLGLGLNSPLKPILYPYQKMLRGYVQQTRLAKNIIVWYESYLSFWLTTLAFGASLVTYFVPWGFLLRWIIRAAVVVCLGPWMKIVDRQIFGYDPNKSIQEQEEEFEKRLKDHYEQRIKSTNIYQVRAERATKLSDMRQFMFGRHLVSVPILHEDLFFDMPSPNSSAEPFTRGETDFVQVKERKFGQFLQGDMIPKRECQVSQETAKLKRGAGKKLVSNGVGVVDKAGKIAIEAPLKALGGVFNTGKKIADQLGGSGGDLSTPLLQQDGSYDSADEIGSIPSKL